MLAASALVVWRFAPPAALSSDASDDRFSARRALDELEHVLVRGKGHPVGSVENGRVRDRLIARLRAHGLQVRSAEHVECSRLGLCSRLVNVIATQAPIQEGQKVVLLAAHYDSVGAGMGAADDGAAWRRSSRSRGCGHGTPSRRATRSRSC